MDIVTHAGIGLIVATPLINSHPDLAVGLVAGSVLPDTDALSRAFGKLAFLRSHQTWTHALPAQAVVSVLAGFVGWWVCGANGWSLGIGLFLGFALHTLLDLSNTLGVTLFAPFSRRRFCLEWVFFIDAVVLGCTAITASFMLWEYYQRGEVSGWYSVSFLAEMWIYFLGKGILRGRAGKFAREAVSLIPSALWPWQFYGTSAEGGCICSFQINALTGRRNALDRYEILDAAYSKILSTLPEYRVMRELSPAYHVVSVTRSDTGEIILCRDMRTRNFATRFGDLEIVLDGEKNVLRTNLHV